MRDLLEDFEEVVRSFLDLIGDRRPDVKDGFSSADWLEFPD